MNICRIHRVSLLLLLTCALCLLPLKSFSWDLAKEGSGIGVYTQSVPGSAFKAYRAEMVIHATVDSLIALVSDIERYPEWIDTCTAAETLARPSDRERLAYTVNSAPWPVTDRDAVVRNTILAKEKTGAVTITIRAEPNALPERAGRIRVLHIRGYWKFVPLASGGTRVIYEVHSEPGGTLPSWLVNSVVVTQPYNTLSNMKALLRHRELDRNASPGGK